MLLLVAASGCAVRGRACSRGNAAGRYAGQPLKAGAAAQPKGCSACFVPFGHGRATGTEHFGLDFRVKLCRHIPKVRK